MPIRLFIALSLMIPALSFAQTAAATNSTLTNGTNAGQGFLQEFYGNGGTNAAARRTATPSAFWSAVKVIFFTALFAVGAYFLIKFLVTKSGLPATEDDKLLEIVLSKPAGLGNYLEIIKLGPTYYLISVSSDGLRLMDKIEDKETIDYIELNREQLRPKEGKFFDLMSFFPKFKKIDKLGFLKKQKDKLRKM